MDQITLSAFPDTALEQDSVKIWVFAKNLLAAKDQYTPVKTVSRHSKPYWSNELSILSNKVREARKKFKCRSNFVNKDLLVSAKEEFSQALALAKNKYIEC